MNAGGIKAHTFMPETINQVVDNFSETHLQELCVQQLFERQAACVPDSVAVICEGKQVTYAELNRRANQLAAKLRSMQVGPETMVGLCMERSLDMVVVILGILKAGGAYVPIDPHCPKDR